MTTILELAKAPTVAKIEVEEYSFETQKRAMPAAGYPTWGTAQTFDYKGQPNDVRSDQDN